MLVIHPECQVSRTIIWQSTAIPDSGSFSWQTKHLLRNVRVLCPLIYGGKTGTHPSSGEYSNRQLFAEALPLNILNQAGGVTYATNSNLVLLKI